MNSPKHAPSFSGGAWILAGALLWSTGGVGIKALTGYGAWTTSAGRSLVCALFFLAVAGRNLRPHTRDLSRIVTGAFLYAFVVSSFVVATRWTTAANAILLQYTAPLWIAILDWMRGRERPARREWVSLAIGGAGVLLCVAPAMRGVSAAAGQAAHGAPGGILALAGDALALISGLAFAILTLILRGLHVRSAEASDGANSANAPGRSADVSSVLLCLVGGNLLAAAIGAPSLLAEWRLAGIPGHAPWLGWLVLLWLGAGQLGGGYWLFQRGLHTARALTASLLCLIEPVLNPLWVALALGERPAVATLVGGALVLASVILTLRPVSRKEPAPQDTFSR